MDAVNGDQTAAASAAETAALPCSRDHAGRNGALRSKARRVAEPPDDDDVEGSTPPSPDKPSCFSLQLQLQHVTALKG